MFEMYAEPETSFGDITRDVYKRQVTNGIEKKMDLISYEQYQFDWAKDYLLEGSLESVQTDLGSCLPENGK